MEKEAKNYGKAYAFFYCKSKKKDILNELPRAQKFAETSQQLEVDAIEGLDNLDTSNDSALTEIVKDAKNHNMSHVLTATLPDAGNRRTAEELYRVLGYVYNSRSLYDKNEPHLGGISYKHGNEYVFLRR